MSMPGREEARPGQRKMTPSSHYYKQRRSRYLDLNLRDCATDSFSDDEESAPVDVATSILSCTSTGAPTADRGPPIPPPAPMKQLKWGAESAAGWGLTFPPSPVRVNTHGTFALEDSEEDEEEEGMNTMEYEDQQGPPVYYGHQK